jgi:hypothetical protein
MADLGVAKGEPHSVERRRHLMELWTLNLSDLDLKISRESRYQTMWFQEFMLLAQGQLFFMLVPGKLKPVV